MHGLEPHVILSVAMIALFAGFVKGAVGFAMPMLMISGLTLFLPVKTALAVLILPTLLTNGAQALRQGWRAARDTIRRFRFFLIVGLLFLLGGAQLVSVLPPRHLFLVTGVAVTAFALLLLTGLRLHVPEGRRALAEGGVAAVAGLVGGMSGVWGPPTVAYLTALDTPKQEQIRAQGVIYGLGAVALFGAHVQTGIVSADTLPLSAAMTIPAVAGLWLGFRLQDRFDQSLFHRMTLIVLIAAGLNLIRRGLLG